jgi:hypothetical protein
LEVGLCEGEKVIVDYKGEDWSEEDEGTQLGFPNCQSGRKLGGYLLESGSGISCRFLRLRWCAWERRALNVRRISVGNVAGSELSVVSGSISLSARDSNTKRYQVN